MMRFRHPGDAPDNVPDSQKSPGMFPAMFPIQFPIGVRDSLGAPGLGPGSSHRLPEKSALTPIVPDPAAPLPAEVPG